MADNYASARTIFTSIENECRRNFSGALHSAVGQKHALTDDCEHLHKRRRVSQILSDRLQG